MKWQGGILSEAHQTVKIATSIMSELGSDSVPILLAACRLGNRSDGLFIPLPRFQSPPAPSITQIILSRHFRPPVETRLFHTYVIAGLSFQILGFPWERRGGAGGGGGGLS